MKKILLLFFSIAAFAKQDFAQQPFCPAGAVWHYDFNALSSGGFHKISYGGDILIDGINCKELKVVEYEFIIPNSNFHYTRYLPFQYIYQNGDTVFQYFHNQFFVLFNFGAQPGDEWSVSDSVNAWLQRHTMYFTC